jgi:hypothetical protein
LDDPNEKNILNFGKKNEALLKESFIPDFSYTTRIDQLPNFSPMLPPGCQP